MNFAQQIRNLFGRGNRIYNGNLSYFQNGWNASVGTLPFADTIFLNCVELLTDLSGDVTWQFQSTDKAIESAFVRFFNSFGKIVLNRLYRDGVVVVKHIKIGEGANAAHEFAIANTKDYIKQTEDDWTIIKPTDPNVEVYALRSATYQTTGKSDRAMLNPFLTYLDNTLNASNTVSERMGAMVVCSPKNLNSSPMATVLDEDEKKELEEQLGKEYGALHKQRSVMVLPREMSWQIISLAQLDLKTMDKVKTAVLAIADRIKVPANQVGLIDAMSSKSLSNGTELREGDYNKYQSFERLLDCTFVQFARDLGLYPGMSEVVQGEVVRGYYTIYNKPKQSAQQQ